MDKEYLVTAQAYDKLDSDKQTILLHETFMAKDANDAHDMFESRFSSTHNIIRIFSAIDTSSEKI